MIIKILKIICLISLIFSSANLEAQNITSNDGFEGTNTLGIPPANWQNCDDGFSTVDTQPGFYNNLVVASEGNTYISLVTRKDGIPGTVETVWDWLSTPLEKDKCYNLSLDLSLSQNFHIDNWGTLYYYNTPCILQIIGFNGDCKSPDQSEVLWESNPIENYSWETFDFTLTPQLASYEKIALRANFSDSTVHENCAVLVDNLRFNNTKLDFIKKNEILHLPIGSTDISWYFNGELVENANSIEMPFLGNGVYKATFYDNNGCYRFAKTDLFLDLELIKIYPNPTDSKITIDSYSLSNENCNLYIYDDIGKLVFEYEFEQIKGLNKTELDLGFLAPSVYYLRINKTDLKNEIHKIIISQ